MKKFAVIAAVIVLAGVIYVWSNHQDVPVYDADFLAWCDDTYHRNVTCPEYGQVVVPPEVLAQEEADHLDWCEKIYHRNVSCPFFGQVEVPPEVLAKEEADHLDWCESINHRNVSCPGPCDE